MDLLYFQFLRFSGPRFLEEHWICLFNKNREERCEYLKDNCFELLSCCLLPAARAYIFSLWLMSTEE